MKTLIALFIISIVHPVTNLTIIHQPNHALHAPPPGVPHAERPDRLDSIMSKLTSDDTDLAASGVTITTASNPLQRVEASINQTHASSYISLLRKTVGGLNSDTYVAPTSYRTMLTASSCWLSCMDIAAESKGPAFALTRPPGHHATKSSGMG